MQETRAWSLGWEDPLEQEMATRSRILAWKIPWTEETGRLQSLGLQIVRHDSAQICQQSCKVCIVPSFFFNERTLGSLVNMSKDGQAESACVRFKPQSFTARTHESLIIMFTWLGTSVSGSDGDKGNNRSKKERKLLRKQKQKQIQSMDLKWYFV